MAHTLVLVRHGQSEWNKKNLFTGWHDAELTEQGEAEATKGGQRLKEEGLNFDVAYTSMLTRAQRTLGLILKELGQDDLMTIADEALNERDYGDLVGLNKDDARAKWGDEQVHIWRRSYDIPPPGGESLKMTAERVLPYFESTIMPDLLSGKTTIVAAHGNSLRALIMKLENISTDDITKLNLPTGVPIIYTLDDNGAVINKHDLAT